jgi:hypothetical protein
MNTTQVAQFFSLHPSSDLMEPTGRETCEIWNFSHVPHRFQGGGKPFARPFVHSLGSLIFSLCCPASMYITFSDSFDVFMTLHLGASAVRPEFGSRRENDLFGGHRRVDATILTALTLTTTGFGARSCDTFLLATSTTAVYMPVPTTTPLRDRRQASPPQSTATPMRTPSRGAYSAYTPTVTSGTGTTKMNVVTRVALEGRAKHGEDGASIKMYLKVRRCSSSPFNATNNRPKALHPTGFSYTRNDNSTFPRYDLMLYNKPLGTNY